MTLSLHLLRHAQATAQGETPGDRARPLEEAGRAAVRRLAAWAAEQRLGVQLVLCSTARRAEETLDILLPVLAGEPVVQFEEELYLADAARLLARLRHVPDNVASVLLVGHNPGLQDLAQRLADVAIGRLAARVAGGFPAAGLASFEIPVSWSALDRGRARLTRLIDPRELPDN
jgi:phosphohistidine phosphatase